MSERAIFLHALEIPDLQQRSRYLDDACRGDSRLRGQVDQLLRAHEEAKSFLEDSPVGAVATQGLGGAAGISASGTIGSKLDFLDSCSTPDRLGTLGGYEVMEVLGHGGMGLVLRAFDVKLSRVVAIKVLTPELAANAMARQRFLREARAAAAITHPNVVTIFAVDETQRLPFIVMECVQGQTLQQKIDSVGALEVEEILRIGAQTALGLTAAHAQGIVHRDVKPGNVLLENGIERVKLTDFGLARAADDVNITQTGQIAGTPQYMSPEQAEGKSIDYRSDLFSLGSVMYAMCTGRPAFRADSALAVLRRVCDDDPRPIQEVNPDIPAWLSEIVERLMAKDPQNRYQTADEVARLLNEHLAHLQRSTLAPRPMRMLPPKTRPLAQEKQEQGKPPRHHQGIAGGSPSKWLLFGGLILGFVLVLAAGTVTFLRYWSPPLPRHLVVERPSGTLFIDNDDPDVVIVVSGGEQVYHDAAGKLLTLQPGYYRVVAMRKNASGSLMHDEQVVVRSDEATVWKRSFRPAPVARAELQIRQDTAREVEGLVLEGWGAALSADGSRMVSSVFERGDGGPREVLSVVNIANQERTFLIEHGKDPTWSPLPDGPIAFVRISEMGEELWLVEADGSNARMLTQGGFPSWSEDGKTLYFYHVPSAEVRAVLVDNPSLPPRTILKNPGTMYPAISPDGTRAIVRKGANGEKLVVLDIASGEPICSVATPAWDGLLPSWSPDGRYLGFGSFAVRDERGLCILDLQAGEARQVMAGQMTMPRWSADGKWVVIDNRRNKKLIVVEAEKLGLERLGP